MENTEEVLAALGQFSKEPATDIPQLLGTNQFLFYYM